MSLKDVSGRLARWSPKLQRYDFQIEHRKGIFNVVADAQSRQNFSEIIKDVESPWDVFYSLTDEDEEAFKDLEYLNQLNNIEQHHSSTNVKVQNHKMFIKVGTQEELESSDIPLETNFPSSSSLKDH